MSETSIPFPSEYRLAPIPVRYFIDTIPVSQVVRTAYDAYHVVRPDSYHNLFRLESSKDCGTCSMAAVILEDE